MRKSSYILHVPFIITDWSDDSCSFVGRKNVTGVGNRRSHQVNFNTNKGFIRLHSKRLVIDGLNLTTLFKHHIYFGLIKFVKK